MPANRLRYLPLALLLAAGCSEPVSPLKPEPAAIAPRLGKTTATDPTATVKIPLSDGGLSLRSDRAFSDGSNSVYADGICGVHATLFLSGSGDMVMDGGDPKYANRKCTNYPRAETVVYPDGTSDVAKGGLISIGDLQSGSFNIPVGTSALRPFHVRVGSARCEGVHWGAPAGGDSALVTRISATTWRVTTQPYPKDQAVCKNTVNGQIVGTPLGHMSIDLTVVSSRAL